VCDTQFTLILFFCLFWTNVQSKRTTRAEPEDHSLKNAELYHEYGGNRFHLSVGTYTRLYSVTSQRAAQ